jgi:hypothetical protein
MSRSSNRSATNGQGSSGPHWRPLEAVGVWGRQSMFFKRPLPPLVHGLGAQTRLTRGMQQQEVNVGAFQQRNVLQRTFLWSQDFKTKNILPGGIPSGKINFGKNSVPSGFGKVKNKFGSEAPKKFLAYILSRRLDEIGLFLKTAGKIMSRSFKPW